MKRILLVEDSSTTALVQIRALRSAGFSVELQRGAKGARAACDGLSFDVYIVDLSIRENEHGGSSDGMDFVRWVRHRRIHARIVVCSSDESREGEVRSVGCAFVSKEPTSTLGKRLVDALG